MTKKVLRISLSSSRGKIPCVALLEGEQFNGNLKGVIDGFKEVLERKLLPVLCLLGMMDDQYPSGMLIINIDNQEVETVDIKTNNAKISADSLEKVLMEMQILTASLSLEICKKIPYCMVETGFNVVVNQN